jgi:hypothetical protein
VNQHTDGTYENFRKEPAPWQKDVEILEGGWINAGYGPYTIEDKWPDENGNSWYKIEYVTGAFETMYILAKVSDSNDTFYT